MSVTAIHHWTCDVCGARAMTAEHTNVYSDPVVVYPEGWGSLSVPEDHRIHPCWDCCDACPTCLKNADWSLYREKRR